MSERNDRTITVKEKPEYCQARTRKAFEAATWGEANMKCGNKAKYQDPKTREWFCRIHIDPRKRY